MKFKMIAIAILLSTISCNNKYNSSIDISPNDSVINISYSHDIIYIHTYNKTDSIYRIYTNDKHGNTNIIRGFKINN